MKEMLAAGVVFLLNAAPVCAESKPAAPDPASELVASMVDSLSDELFKNDAFRASQSPAEKPVITGCVYAMLGNLPGAKTKIENAIALDPKFAFGQFNLASVCALQKDTACSVKALEAAMRLNHRYRKAAEVSPDFDQIRLEPDFQALLKKKLPAAPKSESSDGASLGNYVLPLSSIERMVKTGITPPAAKPPPTLNDVVKISRDYVNKLDREKTTVPEGGTYAKRLRRLTAGLKKEGDYNFKAFFDPAINAISFADGSIRVNSGLMDVLKDDELLAVIGHEIGHVALNHRSKQMLASLALEAWTEPLMELMLKQIIPLDDDAPRYKRGDTAGNAGRLAEGKFSQNLEIEADDFGAAFLLRRSQDPQSAVRALRKLAEFEARDPSPEAVPGSGKLYVSTHLEAAKRAELLDKKLRDGKIGYQK